MVRMLIIFFDDVAKYVQLSCANRKVISQQQEKIQFSS